MRSRLFCLALLPLFVLALSLPAHADMDDFVITGGGQTIDFSLPASTTQVCLSCFGGFSPDQFNFGSVPATVNGVNQPIQINFIIGGICSVCNTIQLSYPSTSWTIFLPSIPLDDITFSGTYPNQNATLTFVPGDYMTGGYSNFQVSDNLSFEIKITPEAAATPEPATILSLLTAAFGLPLLKRRRTARI